MPTKKIFVSQTTNSTVQLTDSNGKLIAIDGILAVDIAGTLGSAKMTTYVRHANADINQWIPVADGTWPFSDTETYSGIDGALILLKSHFVQFALTGTDVSTNLNVSASW